MSPRISGRAADIQPETTEADPIEDQAPETVPDDLAAAAAECAQSASEARERAARTRKKAQTRVTAAEREAARLVSEARSHAVASEAEATAADREASVLEGKSRGLAIAARDQAKADHADQRVRDLEAERAALGADVAEAAARLGQLDAERRDAEGQLATARARSDVEAMAAARARAGAIDDLVASLTGEQEAAQARLARLGDGSRSFPGELFDSRQEASTHHAAVVRLLCDVYPHSAMAIRVRALEEFKGALEGNLERIAEAAAPPESPRTIVAQ